jgi:PIN domain nuclease of toxin-antitoxin system
MTNVFDTSAVIAFMRNEPGADRLAGLLEGAAISAVNLAELITHGVRSGVEANEVRADFAGLKLAVHPFDEEMATVTGALEPATRRYGLSLGDRACLALAKRLGARAVTADRVWAKLDLGITVDVFR